jgi:anti-sigma B factor antagonist
VRVEPLDDAVVLSVSGEIDLVTAPQLGESINAAMDQEPPTLVVDLSDVDFLASAGMAVLLGCNQKAQGRIRFRVVAAGTTTFRPMELTGVPDEIAIFPTREEALAADG